MYFDSKNRLEIFQFCKQESCTTVDIVLIIEF